MQTGYGPALLLGVLIGGAILLDDVITPERKGPPPRVAMFHHGEGMESVKNLTPGGDHNVWVIKGDDPVEAEIHKEIRIELASEEDAADEEQLMISVSVDADDEPAGDLAAAIGAVIDTARAEGGTRSTDKGGSIESAKALAVKAIDPPQPRATRVHESIDVEVLSTED